MGCVSCSGAVRVSEDLVADPDGCAFRPASDAGGSVALGDAATIAALSGGAAAVTGLASGCVSSALGHGFARAFAVAGTGAFLASCALLSICFAAGRSEEAMRREML